MRFSIILTYILSSAVFKLLRSADYLSNFRFRQGVPLFNALIRGEPLKSRLRNLGQERRTV